MADNVVQYILKINADDARKGLKQTEDGAEKASKEFDDLSHSTERASKSMSRFSTSAKSGALSARNLRRAGRDLDGAFGDLAQGVGHLNPVMGQLLMNVSDGASVVEGLGRSLSLFLNPAFLAAGSVALGAGLALLKFDRDAELAKKQTEELDKKLDDARTTIESTESTLYSGADALLDFAQRAADARLQLDLLTGKMSELDLANIQAERTGAAFASQIQSSTEDQIKAGTEAIKARRAEINALREKISVEKENRKIVQSAAREAIAGPQFEEIQAGSTEENLRKQLTAAREALEVDKEALRTAQGARATAEIRGQQLTEDLQTAAKLRDEEKKRQEQQRRAAAARAEQQRQEQAAEREFAAEVKRVEGEARKRQAEENKNVADALNARRQLAALASSTELSARQRIIDKLNEEITQVNELANTSGDRATADEVIANLRAKAAEDLKKLNEEETKALQEKLELEKQIAREKRRTVSIQEISNKLNEVSNMSLDEIGASIRGHVDDLLAQLDVQRLLNKAKTAEIDIVEAARAAGQGVQTAATGTITDIASLISPALGGALSFLEDVGSKTPEERREELTAQVEAIRDGISYLPEIFLQILPQFTLALIEAIVDGFQLFLKNLGKVIGDALSFRDRSPEERESRREARRRAVSDFFDPNKTATFMGGGRFIPRAEGGIRFTGNQDGLAMLHRGEFVVPASGQMNQQVNRQLNQTTGGGGVVVNINSAVVDRSAVDRLVREIEVRFNNKFGVSSSNLFGGR